MVQLEAQQRGEEAPTPESASARGKPLRPPHALPLRPLPVPRPTSAGAAGAASLRDVKAALNEVAKKLGFSCRTISWEDAQRATTGKGKVTSWGRNISDVRLFEKNGRQLYTLRSQNWNEQLGLVSAKDVALVVGNHVAGGSTPSLTTLEAYLQQIGTFAGYCGVAPSTSLHNPDLDHLFSIRFQTVFLPIGGSRDALQFCTDVYNHNTRSDDDPRNLLLLCTAQGTSVQQDGSKAKKVFHHEVDSAGVIHRYWLEAERSSHAVGGMQVETAEEAAAAAARGKSTAMIIGTRAMGTRFNVQMLVQLPLAQQAQRARMAAKTPPYVPGTGLRKSRSSAAAAAPVASSAAAGDLDRMWHAPTQPSQQVKLIKAMMTHQAEDDDDGMECSTAAAAAMAPPPMARAEMAAPITSSSSSSSVKLRRGTMHVLPRPGGVTVSRPAAKVEGTCNAARVSRGAEQGTWTGVANKTPVRDVAQHGTITVTMYYTVAGGVPSPADVQLAIDDLKTLYSQCAQDKRLAQAHEVTAPLQGTVTLPRPASTPTPVVPAPYVPPTHPPAERDMAFPE